MVAIFDRDQLLERRRCRVVPLPNGGRGALWRGLAWPLDSDDKIDASGPAFPLVAQPSRPISAPAFGLIDGVEEAWVIFDGSVTVREAAAAALRRAGITILRSGPWLGDVVDGVHGTGFIRFVRPATDELRPTLASILAACSAPANDTPNLEDRLRAVTVELTEVRAELARVQLTKAEPETSHAPGLSAELVAARAENLALLEEITELRRQVTVIESARPQPEIARAGIRLQEEIAAFVSTLRPDLRFLRDSLVVLAGEFPDRRGVYSAILELGGITLGRHWKVIRGASGWWERHVRNGQDDTGRLYVRRNEGGWDLLISHKADQDRDIRWLSAH